MLRNLLKVLKNKDPGKMFYKKIVFLYSYMKVSVLNLLNFCLFSLNSVGSGWWWWREGWRWWSWSTCKILLLFYFICMISLMIRKYLLPNQWRLYSHTLKNIFRVDAFSIILKNNYLFPWRGRTACITGTQLSKSSISFRSSDVLKDFWWICWGALKIEQLWA